VNPQHPGVSRSRRVQFVLIVSLLAAASGCHKKPDQPTQAPTTLPAAHPAAAQQPQTGIYGDTLTLIRMPDGSLTGSFAEERGEQPSFSCGFLLQSAGPLSPEHRMPVTTWWPDRELNGGKDDGVTTGTLFVQGDSVSLQLPEQAHGGCWNVEPELDHGEVTEIGAGAPHPEWKSLRVVASSRLALHHRPDANDITKAYIVRGDILALLDTTPQDGVWHHVQLVAAGGPKGTGWVLDSGLMPWSVPAH
jgi:hypothetical protein